MSVPDETKILEHVVERLAVAYPALARPALVSIVQEELQSFDDSPVRDFIPVLTERRVKMRLAAG